MSLLKIELPFRIKKPILAVGSDIKNSLCFAYGRYAFINQVINDLQIWDNFKRFQERMVKISRYFGRAPKIIAYDKHPEYLSTKYILSLPKSGNMRLISVQHHHAHITSCMIENKLKNQKVIGVAFDGTGFGDDNTLWGAEFLVADYKGFQRVAHLRNIPLLGGQKAIYEPWRVASAWLYLAFGEDFLNLNLNFTKKINRKNWKVLKKMWGENFNSPAASSMGRLFDAIAALVLGICQVKSEAEAAINLERIASDNRCSKGAYRFKIKKSDKLFIIDPVYIFKDIVADLKKRRKKEDIASCFHMTVAQIINKACLKIRDNTKINKVVLVGGVFQNKLLFRYALDLLRKSGFRILTHKQLPCSDVSISLGQAAVASFSN